MKFKLTNFCDRSDRFTAETEDGQIVYLDLTTDATFPEIVDSPEYEELNNGGYSELMKTFVGRTIECESITPYIPMYFVQTGKFIE